MQLYAYNEKQLDKREDIALQAFQNNQATLVNKTTGKLAYKNPSELFNREQFYKPKALNNKQKILAEMQRKINLSN